ncbi:YbaB/EbfC family nucleoid-associated protein [Couchioplanes azureus]|uniref:YbaB/EbfC family nucleoid-associated protein n=1 Tax=Couchioplanes caeruleus TaxID=56438 RepID=UPI0016717676|nr:YbaB/EbfC family nucleoid-associated protein [Couchioplanes caeruleus]GGQ71044.1 hypothetical protein GCM10010166_46430 [Couchioplanes caeruleus subsp. azureus]
MFDGQNLGGAERLIDDWQEEIEKRAAQGRELARRMAHLTASARSSDNLVELTVDSSGVVTDIRLDEGIRQQSAARTAREILATIGSARAALRDKAESVVADTVGVDTETGRAVLASYAKSLKSA